MLKNLFSPVLILGYNYLFFLVGGSKVENVFLIQTSKTTNNIRNKYGDEGLNAFVFSNCKNKIHVKIICRETTHYYTVLNVS